MKQIVSSNRMYILIVTMYNKNVLTLIEIENDVIRDKTIWPAVIFAARRNLRVTGRTIILIVSIITKNGYSHRGALSGRR